MNPLFQIWHIKTFKNKKSVDYYLQLKKVECSFCIDAIIVNDDGIELIENITI